MGTDPLLRATDAGHLTAVLRQSGTLGDGRVRDAVVESSRPTILSNIVRLRLTYDGAAADGPRSLILKTGHTDRIGSPWSAGRQEVAFYTQVAPEMSARLVPCCFEAHWDADTGAWHLLLEDLADTHIVATDWPLPPALAQCQRILRARARFHAEWWDDPRLGVSVGTRPDACALDQHARSLADQFAHFADCLGDSLPRDRRDLYERLLDAAPRLLAHHRLRRNLTVIQGDAHVWNCFLPRDDAGDDVRFFDWDSWRVAAGSADLAYMMALHWYPDLRRRMERPLLDSYHAALVAYGVRGYDRRALDDDYRASVLWQITTPVWQAAAGIPPVIWWNNLERVLLAADDLGCRDLLA